MLYACQHCGWTAPVVEGEPEPTCPDHPETPVRMVDPEAFGQQEATDDP